MLSAHKLLGIVFGETDPSLATKWICISKWEFLIKLNIVM